MVRLHSSDSSPGWINREIREIKRELRELRAAKGLAAATVGEGGITIKGGGNLTIEEEGDLEIQGGRFRVRYPDDEGGDDAVFAGDVYADDGAGPYQGSGLLVEQPDGTDILNVRSDATDGVNARMNDRNGFSAFMVDPAGGVAWPWMAVMVVPARYTDWPKTTSGAFETLWAGYVPRANPRVRIDVRHTSDAVDTAGEVRVLVGGSTLGGVDDIGFVIAQHFVEATPAAGFGGLMYVEVQARRTAGAGNVMCAPYQMTGTQST